MAINALTHQMFEAERRRAEREVVFFRTTLRAADGPVITAQLVNISRGGFMVRADTPLPEGTQVGIALPAIGEPVARIVWALGGRIGAQFIEPIDPASYFGMIAALPRN
jgi:hypothetical protein